MPERTVPYIIFEGEMARQERTIKRLWIMCLITLVLLVGSNICWIFYEAQFEDIVITQDGEADENGNVRLNGVANGDIYDYGESTTDNQN